jgi:hypothetical protein
MHDISRYRGEEVKCLISFSLQKAKRAYHKLEIAEVVDHNPNTQIKKQRTMFHENFSVGKLAFLVFYFPLIC